MKTRISIKVGVHEFRGMASTMAKALEIIEGITGENVFPEETDGECVAAKAHAFGAIWSLEVVP